jgi:putative transposase
MDRSHRFRAYTSRTGNEEACDHHRDQHRQVYNHALHDYDQAPEGDKPTRFDQNEKVKEWRNRWPQWRELSSTAMQATVRRLHHSLTSLSELKENGHSVGKLRRKSPREYRSITYVGKSFDLDEKRGSADMGYVRLAKIGWIPFRQHREIPDNAEVKEVTLKKERTGEWYVSFALDHPDEALPDKPDVDEIDVDDCVGIDLGILNYIHTSDGLSVGRLDLEGEYERLSKAPRTLSRREEGNENWEKARRRVASVKRRIRRKVLDFQHKLTTWLTREHDAVFVEDLDVQAMLEDEGNALNKQDAAWRQFITLLQYKADLYGCYVEQVPPENTTKECASCGVEVEKELWVREHSCPSCGFEADRDWNAALNVLQRGLEMLGVGCSEGTPVETAAAAGTEAEARDVPVSRVVEAGNPVPQGQGSPAPPRAG